MGLLLQVAQNGRVAVPAGITSADLRRVHHVGRDALFVDEGVDLWKVSG